VAQWLVVGAVVRRIVWVGIVEQQGTKAEIYEAWELVLFVMVPLQNLMGADIRPLFPVTRRMSMAGVRLVVKEGSCAHRLCVASRFA